MQNAGSEQQRLSAPVQPQAMAAAGTYHIVHNFGGSPDGADPAAKLAPAPGGLYGTTLAGGKYGFGTFFLVTAGGAESVRYSFGGTAGDGEGPYGVFDDKGTLYGTTQNTNSTTNCGTIYTITTAGVEQIVHTFSNAPDGCNPVAPLLTNYDGNLVGTTEHGGNAAGDGTAFTIIKSTGTYKVQHIFKGTDGANPESTLRTLYSYVWGMTANGGSKNGGTLFAMNADTGAIVLEHAFGSGTDGSHPVGGLLLIGDIVYGTTESGGTHLDGMIFSKSQSNLMYKDVYDFKGSPDGVKPIGTLVNVNGTFYGVTVGGGQFGLGTVYKVTPTGTETVLHSFSGGLTDGSTPESGLVELGGLLYGTTSLGGSSGHGTVFVISP